MARPAPRPQPRPQAPRTEPAVQREPTPQAIPQRPDLGSLEEALAEMESDTEPAGAEEEPSPAAGSDLPVSPKTSEEMLEEARRKWGSNRP